MGRKSGNENNKIHFRLEYNNPLTNTWQIKGEYPTIRSMIKIIGYNYNIIQNIRLNRHKTLNKFIRITRIKENDLINE